jgi:outer membrane protein, multidrug efflux system
MMRYHCLFLILTLAACTVGPDYAEPKLDLPDAWHRTAAAPGAAADGPWWQEFGDAELNRLIEKALQNSPTVKIAEARIAEARGARRTAASGLFPQVSADGSAERTQTGIGSLLSSFSGGGSGPAAPSLSKPIDVYDASFDASWEIDLFGGTRRQIEAAGAAMEARQADLREARITLAGDVARSYIEWLDYQQQAKLVKATAASQRQLFDIAERKYRVGTGSRFEASQARTLYKSTLAKLPAIEQQREAVGYQLSLLLGEPAGALNDELAQYKDLPRPHSIPALASPADTIRLRPDVRSAERELAASTALTGAAIAQLYPQLTLSGMYGIEDTSLSNPTRIWTLAGGLAAPLLDFGRIHGGIDQAKARQEEAYQQYRQTVLAAVAEIETDLSAVAKANAQAIRAKGAAISAESTLTMAHERFREGISPFTETLDAEQAEYSARNDYVQAKAQLLTALISLHKALAQNP